MIYDTTDTHVLELIGESNQKDRVKGGKFWSIEADDDKTFQLREVHIMYSGEPLERECFVKEEYDSDKAAGDMAYMEVVRALKSVI